jgi:RES domain-containing protein
MDMSNTQTELLYTQDDMDLVLARARNAEKENELTHQLLWAVIEAAGGEIAVPHSLFLRGPSERELLVWDDHAKFQMRLKVSKKDGGDV